MHYPTFVSSSIRFLNGDNRSTQQLIRNFPHHRLSTSRRSSSHRWPSFVSLSAPFRSLTVTHLPLFSSAQLCHLATPSFPASSKSSRTSLRSIVVSSERIDQRNPLQRSHHMKLSITSGHYTSASQCAASSISQQPWMLRLIPVSTA